MLILTFQTKWLFRKNVNFWRLCFSGNSRFHWNCCIFWALVHAYVITARVFKKRRIFKIPVFGGLTLPRLVNSNRRFRGPCYLDFHCVSRAGGVFGLLRSSGWSRQAAVKCRQWNDMASYWNRLECSSTKLWKPHMTLFSYKLSCLVVSNLHQYN